MYAALRRHPSIWIVPLLAVLVLATGGIVGVMTAAATETRQAKLIAEGKQGSKSCVSCTSWEHKALSKHDAVAAWSVGCQQQ
jgi:hypothetical protein